jgi:hypothetical protein
MRSIEAITLKFVLTELTRSLFRNSSCENFMNQVIRFSFYLNGDEDNAL